MESYAVDFGFSCFRPSPVEYRLTGKTVLVHCHIEKVSGHLATIFPVIGVITHGKHQKMFTS